MAALLALGACSGGGGDGASEGRDGAPSDPETTTTAASARIDLSQPIPGGSLHGTPRPPLENTGDDFVAIFESLVANLRWLYENPDPSALADIYVMGTAEHAAGVENFEYLVDRGWRAKDDGYHLVSVAVRDARPEAVVLDVVDQFTVEALVDQAGDQVGEGRVHSGPDSWTVLMAPDASGRWRVADWAPAESGSVQL